MHVGDIDSLITTITSFQVSDSQDSVMELSTDPSPTLSQVLVLVTQSTLTTDEDATTAPGVESTPDTMEPIPFTAPAFLPTVDQTVFLPTLSRDSEPGPGLRFVEIFVQFKQTIFRLVINLDRMKHLKFVLL